MNLDAELLALVGLGLGFAVATIFVGRRWPQVALAAWLLVVCFVPIWVEARLLVPWSAASGFGLLVLLAYLSRGLPLRWGLPDLLMTFLFVGAAAPYLLGRLSLSSLAGILSVWLVGYGLGRMAPRHVDLRWIFGAVAVFFTIVAFLAVIEFVTGWHGLASWGPSNASRAGWGSIQVRGGLERSEGAFGHSIALGTSLAMAMVLTIESRFRSWLRFAMIATMLCAVAVTFSRTAVICAVLGLVASIAVLRSAEARAMRRWLVGLLVVGLALLVPFLLGVFEASDEAEGSAAYRGSLLSLVQYFQIAGVTDALEVTASGRSYFAGYRSIDSQFILFGLSYGWLTLSAVLLLLGLAIFQLLRGRAQAPTVAIVAQIPALATVALITQYHLLFWFVGGLAVAAEVMSRASTSITRVLEPRSTDSAPVVGSRT